MGIVDILLDRQEFISLKVSMRSLIYFKHLCKVHQVPRHEMFEKILVAFDTEEHFSFWEFAYANPESLEQHFKRTGKKGQQAEDFVRKEKQVDDRSSMWE